MLNILKQFSAQIISPDLFIRKRYATFQELLSHDRECHSLLAELEDIYYNSKPVDINRVRNLYGELSTGVAKMLTALFTLAPGQYKSLTDYYKKIDFYTRFALAPPQTATIRPFILPIEASYPDDRHTGGKGLHLSHLAHTLGLPIPAGFIISTSAWNYFLETNDLRPKINRELARTDVQSVTSLHHVSQAITGYIGQAKIPPELEENIAAAVKDLALKFPDSSFAVRSSAVGEDSSLSFAGQYCSLLNVEKDAILTAYHQVLASKYTPEAILYRIISGLDDEETPMGVIVLIMVDACTSGVVTTGTPGSPDGTATLVHSVCGLGDRLMDGRVTPATIAIHQLDGKDVITRQCSEGSEHELSDAQFCQLAAWAKEISAHYGKPQEIEWSCDHQGTIYLLQARPLKLDRHQSDTPAPDLSHLHPRFQGGKTASPGIGCGSVYHIPAPDNMQTIPAGAILVCEVTPPSLVTLLPHLSGVICRYGSIADHFSSVAREFGIPVLVQVPKNKIDFDNGEELTLWADKQTVFSGIVQLPSGYIESRRQQQQDSPLQRTLKMVIEFISPLALVDPASREFCPKNCRSLHDIIRFAHEKSVLAMFIQSTDSFLRKPKSSRLQSLIPLEMHIIDVGGGLSPKAVGKKEVSVAAIQCLPLRVLLQGLSHPGVQWRDRAHFDWRSYDAIALAGGVSTKTDSALASFCLISSEYLNVNLRFGYHFTLLDCLCGDTPEENYILMRFAGGGGQTLGKDLRLTFISRVLTRLNFACEQTGELLDARLMRYDKEITADRLDLIGRLLGAVRLLDMVLHDAGAIDVMVDDFFLGKYDFSNE